MNEKTVGAKAANLREQSAATFDELQKRISYICQSLIEIRDRLFGPEPAEPEKVAAKSPAPDYVQAILGIGGADLRDSMAFAQGVIDEIARKL